MTKGFNLKKKRIENGANINVLLRANGTVVYICPVLNAFSYVWILVMRD